MGIQVANTAERERGDRYKWTVRLEGDPAELDQVKEVTYMLHPTFPNPVRTITDRRSNFALTSKGWGEFELKLKILKMDGSVERKTHWLRLPGRA